MADNKVIIRAILEGDLERYRELVEPYIERLHAISYSYLRNTQAAEDVTQDALIKAYKALRTLAKPESFGAWLQQITRNLSLSALRRKKSNSVNKNNYQQNPVNETQDPMQLSQNRNTLDLLNTALTKISPRISETIILFYLKEQSIQQISEFLGVTENTVKQRLYRGRMMLREHIEEIEKIDGQRTIRLSSNFLPGVIAALPSQPAASSTLSTLLTKLAALPLIWPLLLPLVSALASSSFSTYLLASDIKKSNHQARKSMRQTAAIGMILLISLIVIAHTLLSKTYSLESFIPKLLIMTLFVALFALYYLRHGATNRMKISFLAPLGLLMCMVCLLIIPQYFIYIGVTYAIIWIAGHIAMTISSPALTPIKHEISANNLQELPMSGSVSKDFLHEVANDFLKTLNTPFPIFHNITKKSSHVCFSAHSPTMSKFISWLSKKTEKWKIAWCRFGTARLYLDGSVEYELYSNKAFPPIWGTAKEETQRVSDYVSKSWQYYLSGDLVSARDITPDFFPDSVYASRKGKLTLARLMYIVIFIFIVSMIGVIYYSINGWSDIL